MLAFEKRNALEAANAGAPASPVIPRFLRTHHAAQFADVGRSTLYEWLSAGHVKSHRVGGVRLIDRESLEKFITSHAAA